MYINKYCILLIIWMFGTKQTYSQESLTEIYVDFRVNSTVLDSSYSVNAARMQEIVDFLRHIREDHTIDIVEISFRGAASPEGSDQLNRRLARERSKALENFVRHQVEIPDSLITRSNDYIPWDYLKTQIEASDLFRKDEVLSILEEQSPSVDDPHSNTHVDYRIMKLKALEDGKVWQQMNKLFFSRMRNACAVFITCKKKTKIAEDPVVIGDTVAVERVVEVSMPPTATVDSIAAEEDAWIPKLHIKTNAIALCMAIANIAAEIDLANHWSFALPVYHCAWNYFKSTIKFRVFSIYPEVRYWLSEHNEGVFAGAHFGMVFYNFAFNGNYRYQRHHRDIPAMGGGLSIGYRMPLSKSRRWQMEYSIGAGLYPLNYDKFRNTPDTKDGLLVDNVKKTYWGIDQITVSFSYMFDLKKKGGKR